MAQSSVGTQRLDPYKNFKLKLTIGGRTYTGSVIAGLFPPPDPADYRAGNDNSTAPRKLTGRSNYESVTLKRGVTQEPSFSSWASQLSGHGKFPSLNVNRGVTQDPSFSSWASQVLTSSLGSEVSPENFRKHILLQFYNEAGQLAVTYRLTGSYVWETQAKPPRVFHHVLRPGNAGAVEEQLAAIFENSLHRLMGG